jgi:hypothetical protein
MNKERGLLPWILGGLSAAAIAVAFAAVSTHRTAPSLPSQVVAAQPLASPPALPAPTIAPAPSPAAALSPTEPNPVPSSTPPPPQVQNAVAPEMPGGQIWECVTNGVKTFSNNPCGEKSTQLDVGPINTMSAAAAIHYVRAYAPEPRYAPGYTDQSARGDADEYPDESAAETGGNSYTIVQGVGFVPRRRPEHHNPMPPPHHNPAPVRRY